MTPENRATELDPVVELQQDSGLIGERSLELPTPVSEQDDVEVTHPGAVHGEQQAVEAPPDASEQGELDAQTLARRDAALRHVRKFGDPALRSTALPVERFDGELQ